MKQALANLDFLIGEWDVEISFPTDPPGTVHAPASFEWLEGGAFLAYRLGDRADGMPAATFIIGGNESTEVYTALYADDRGVSRVYQMRFHDREWTMWRESPGFSQRFAGTLSADGNTISAHWDKSLDDTVWEHDFDLTYRRVE